MTVSEECSVEHIGGILADQTARRILTEARQESQSADALSEIANVSKPTIYRRLDDLRICDLILEETELHPEGHHRDRFATDLNRIIVELNDEGFTFELDRREAMADRFTRLIEEM